MAINQKGVRGSREEPKEMKQNREEKPPKRERNNGKGQQGEDEKVTPRQREDGRRIWERGEVSEAQEEPGCEEDLPPSAHNTRLLLEHSWEQTTSKS